MLQLGDFVTTNLNNLGIGKAIDFDSKFVTIEYFDSPSEEERHTFVCQVTQAKQVILSVQTRVFVKDPYFNIWRVGRLFHVQEPTYYIKFPNNEEMSFPESEVYVRWRRSIANPSKLLADKLTGTPFFFEARSKFVNELLKQRASTSGMSALLSSCIELEEHQIEVVRRVLSDPVQRYLLADEVGLGKTIEAGVIIRQNVIDNPHPYNILIVVPNHLFAQWHEELSEKFFLDIYLGNSIHIVQESNIDRIREYGNDAKMLVVDEVHHISAYAQSEQSNEFELYAEIKSIAEKVDKLLLLSATPVLHNENSFLAILHLLDPEVYSLEDVDSFKDKILKRQEIAEIFHNFTEDTPNVFLNDSLEELRGYFSNDKYLNSHLNKLGPLIGFGNPEDSVERNKLVKSIRIYLSETYRLHRRLLRNRRTENLESLLIGRDGMEVIKFEEPICNEIEELLDNWRVEVSLLLSTHPVHNFDEYSKLFLLFIELFHSDLILLQEVFEIRLGIRGSEKSSTFSQNKRIILNTIEFQTEEEILKKVLVLIDKFKDKEDQKFSKLTVLIDILIRKSNKIVIFTSYKDSANRLYDSLSKIYGNQVIRHSTQIEEDYYEKPAWTSF